MYVVLQLLLFLLQLTIRLVHIKANGKVVIGQILTDKYSLTVDLLSDQLVCLPTSKPNFIKSSSQDEVFYSSYCSCSGRLCHLRPRPRYGGFLLLLLLMMFSLFTSSLKKLLLIRLPVVVLEQLQLQAVLVCLNLSV